MVVNRLRKLKVGEGGGVNRRCLERGCAVFIISLLIIRLGMGFYVLLFFFI